MNESEKISAALLLSFSKELKEQISRLSSDLSDEESLVEFEKILAEWRPLYEIEFDKEQYEKTLLNFGRTVDDIEAHRFTAPTVERLWQKEEDGVRFATRMCRICDARFGCPPYREYIAAEPRHPRPESQFRKYLGAGSCEKIEESEDDDRLDVEIAALEFARNYTDL